jgi:hypothetical protein
VSHTLRIELQFAREEIVSDLQLARLHHQQLAHRKKAIHILNET